MTFPSMLDMFCRFADKFELAQNDPSYEFQKRRMDFLDEEVAELKHGIETQNDEEILDGAIDVAFIAINAGYILLRHKGFNHHQAVIRLRCAMRDVGECNLAKLVPTEKGAKVKKPEGWKPPNTKEWLKVHKTT